MSLTFSGQLGSRVQALEPPHPPQPARPLRRVRYEVRDGMAVIAFSAAASCGLATALMVFLSLVG